jgi:mono/diheme cytochrome c family protein
MTMFASQLCRVAIVARAVVESGAAPGSVPGGTSGGAAEQSAAPSVSTLHEGYRRYQAVCAHCHGPDGAGSTFAPAGGRINGNSVMKGFAGDPNVVPYVNDIYAYLRARAEHVLGRGRPADGGPGGGGLELEH